MIEIDLPPGLVRVVKQEEVAGLSCYGWRLVAMTTSDVALELKKKKEKPRDRDGRFQEYCTLTDISSEETRGSVALFVMWKDEKSVIASMSAQIDAFGFQITDSMKTAREMTRELEKANEMIREKDGEIVDLSRMYKNADNDRKEFACRMNVIEADLDKVRKSIGDAKMKEITGK